ncbi:thioesterase-like superfamily-domain-containing protein [Scheffersomyces xylosifermentans]|uniref:thioesterase-like superfamily-domain-containing protein n=1 Tax=Scheffersomyces xylosifermentans TaxID=1304137 RepID=UPI00315D9A7B
MPGHNEDFEEAFRVVKIDENTWKGAYNLELPMKLARGVYGGHTVAQTLLVAIETTRNATTNEVFVPESFHLYFIRPGDSTTPMIYKVTRLYDDEFLSKRAITVVQKDKVRSTCLCTLIKRGSKGTKEKKEAPDLSTFVPPEQLKYPDPDKLYQVHHTGYVRNAYSDEFRDFTLCPEEDKLRPAERWITRRIIRPHHQQSFKDPIFNYIGLADLSDSAMLTTLARVLHLPWNPTEDHPFQEFDSNRDARMLMRNSLNILHVFHYNAMSLDHHIYFHNDDWENNDKAYDIVKEWLCFTYQMKRLANNRTLVRGFMFNKNHKCVATVIQEGLTYMFNAVPDRAHLGDPQEPPKVSKF